ncbi:MAG: DUF167 domain-containing protein [bacterium]|nr:DUF167 domain-containing protein [bacterium]
MRIFVKAKTRSRQSGIEQLDVDHYKVNVQEPPVDNKANFAILEAVARHFSVSLGQVRLVSGRDATNKVIEIEK